MKADSNKTAPSKFPFRHTPSIRQQAEALSQKEGVSLNQFVNVAVAEKIAHAEYNEWKALRATPPAESLARALEILNRPSGNPPEPGDELPKAMKLPHCRRKDEESRGLIAAKSLSAAF